MSKTFRLQIITPERVFLEDDAEMLVVRAPDGTCGRFVRLDTEAIEAILRLAAHPDGEEAAQ